MYFCISKLQVTSDRAINKGLVMREFFFMLASRISNWDRVEGNSLCLQIPWDKNDDHLSRFKQV